MEALREARGTADKRARLELKKKAKASSTQSDVAAVHNESVQWFAFVHSRVPAAHNPLPPDGH